MKRKTHKDPTITIILGSMILAFIATMVFEVYSKNNTVLKIIRGYFTWAGFCFLYLFIGYILFIKGKHDKDS